MFLEIALRNAARGFRVHPLIPKEKRALVKGWPEKATTDESTIRAWAEEYPEANCGVVVTDELCVLESDNFEGFVKFLGQTFLSDYDPFKTFTVQARPNRPHFYFYQTETSRQLGNLDLPGIFEFKQNRRYVVGEGSISPHGPTYVVINDAEIVPIPDWIVDMLATARKKKADMTPEELIPTGGRHEYLTSVAGKLRNSGCDAAAIEAALIPINETRLEDPLPHADIKHIAESVSRYEVPQEIEVRIGPQDAKPEDFEEVTDDLLAAPLPEYPAHVWEGTIYQDFGRLASEGTYIPISFFIEAALTFTGSLMGDRVTSTVENLNGRLYTVLLALPGIGKGTTFRRTPRLFESSRMFYEMAEGVVPPPVSVMLSKAASEPGMNDAFLAYPHILSLWEEMDSLMEKTNITGSGGSLMSVLRTLFDDTCPGFTKSKDRKKVAELGYLSLLGAMTPNIWRRSMEGKDPYGTGLGGRFNLVATNETRTKELLPRFDCSQQVNALAERFRYLDANSQTIVMTDAANEVLKRWWADKKDSMYNRVNVIVAKKALHLAWVTGSPNITGEIMERCILLGDYLNAVRLIFAPIQGEEAKAINENRVLQLLRSLAPKALRQSKVHELLEGTISRSTIYNALKSLEATGEVTSFEKVAKKGGRYRVYRVAVQN